MAPAATPVDVGTQRLARPAGAMALGTTLSRITGLGRILAMAFGWHGRSAPVDDVVRCAERALSVPA